MDVEGIGANLKRLRDAKGWSLRQLAERTALPGETRPRVNHSVIDRIEKGEQDRLDLSKVQVLVETLGASLADVLGAEAYEDDHRYGELAELNEILAGLPVEDRELVLTVARRLHTLQQLQERGVTAGPRTLRGGEVEDRASALG